MTIYILKAYIKIKKILKKKVQKGHWPSRDLDLDLKNDPFLRIDLEHHVRPNLCYFCILAFWTLIKKMLEVEFWYFFWFPNNERNKLGLQKNVKNTVFFTKVDICEHFEKKWVKKSKFQIQQVLDNLLRKKIKKESGHSEKNWVLNQFWNVKRRFE